VTINAINFYGFKVLQLKQDKDTAWQKAYIAIARSLVDFVVNNKDEIGDWKGAADAAEFWANQYGKSEKEFRGVAAPSKAPAAGGPAGNLLAEV